MKRILLLIGITAVATTANAEGSRRYAEMRSLEHIEGRRFRAFISVFEATSMDAVRYPLVTLDRSAFQFFEEQNPDIPARADSLWTSATLSPKKARATVFVFEDSDELSTKQAAEVRKAVAEILPIFHSDYLSVIAVSNTRRLELATTDPLQSENLKALQRQVNASQSLGKSSDLLHATCAASQRIGSWSDDELLTTDQRSIVIVGPAVRATLPEDTSLMSACATQLKAKGFRIFYVLYKSHTRPLDVAKIDGSVHLVPSPVDIFPALSNVASLLNDEYVVDFTLPQEVSLRPQIGIAAKISYHGDVFASSQKNVQVPMDVLVSALPPESTPSANEKPRGWWIEVILFAVGAASMVSLIVVLRRYWRRRKLTTICNQCGWRVDREYKACPWQNHECVARLTVLAGPDMGRQLPLFAGRNSLGSGSRCTVVLRKSQGIKRKHSWIEIQGERALYSTTGSDRVNGWLVREPRLLGSGSIINIGELQLFFEAGDLPVGEASGRTDG